MKLLIVDDEEITRNGLLTSINWENLGISQVFLADDGRNGLNIAKKEKPDIVLCDIRMPRMSGIEMAAEIETFLSDVSIIFMSGYSDKEYLKAAIRLKAITYVEKPLDLVEVQEAVIDARNRYQILLRSRKNEALSSNKSASQFALLLTKPYMEQKDKIKELIQELNLQIKSTTNIITFIVHVDENERDNNLINQTADNLKCILSAYNLKLFYTPIHSSFHVYHVIGNSSFSNVILNDISNKLNELYSLTKKYYICQGERQIGIPKAYQSYASAVLLVQNSFYYNPGAILSCQNRDFNHITTHKKLPHDLSSSFTEVLVSKDQNKCLEFLDTLNDFYYENNDLLPTQTKDDYYKLFSALNDFRKKYHLSAMTYTIQGNENMMEYLMNCFSFVEMHNELSHRTYQLFEDLNAQSKEDSTIFIIKEYISKNYSNDSLSIKDISDHVFMSTSYICTYFKNQTGSTLNQYITEYRMEVAEQLLSDPRYPINDISSKIGYSNGNYFSKSFKKFTGLSPSKYREKILG